MDIKTEKKRIVPLEQIPENFLGNKLSKEQRESLSYGYWSEYHETIEISGVNKSGKFRFENVDGEIKARFNFKKEKLEIPNEINGTKLNKQQQEDLKKGNYVYLKDNDKDYYIKIDPELNSIRYDTPHQLGIPKEFLGYKLTDKDKTSLSQGQNIGLRAYKTDDKYFVAELGMSNNMKSIEINNITEISFEQYQKLALDLNPKDEKTNIVNEFITEADKLNSTNQDHTKSNVINEFVEQANKLNTSTSKEASLDKTKESEFFIDKQKISGADLSKAIEDDHYEKANAILNAGVKPDNNHYDMIDKKISGYEKSLETPGENKQYAILLNKAKGFKDNMQNTQDTKELDSTETKEPAKSQGEAKNNSQGTSQTGSGQLNKKDHEFLENSSRKNYNALAIMNKNGYVPSDLALKELSVNQSLKDIDKAAITSIFDSTNRYNKLSGDDSKLSNKETKSAKEVANQKDNAKGASKSPHDAHIRKQQRDQAVNEAKNLTQQLLDGGV